MLVTGRDGGKERAYRPRIMAILYPHVLCLESRVQLEMTETPKMPAYMAVPGDCGEVEENNIQAASGGYIVSGLAEDSGIALSCSMTVHGEVRWVRPCKMFE